MNDFITILGQVVGGIFGPWLVLVLTFLLIVVAFIWSCFSGSEDARSEGIPWQITLASWIGFVIILLLGISLMMWVLQFDIFSWTLTEAEK